MGLLHLVIVAQCVLLQVSSAFVEQFNNMMLSPHQSAMMMASSGEMYADKLITLSGKPVCRYALGGAARSTQPKTLPFRYRDILQSTEDAGAPFYFYYNPHRYPEFLSGVAKTFDGSSSRGDMFFASGGTDRDLRSIDKRLEDALAYCGEYLDAFVLEYVCPYELDDGDTPGPELQDAIEHLHSLDKVRYVMASTHSHRVGRALASGSNLDALMLRYNMNHKKAAETISFPEAINNNIPVLAFTTTRWNRLQRDSSPSVTTSDCIKFALNNQAVEVVLHSARDEDELEDALLPLFSCPDQCQWMSESKYDDLRTYYGGDEMDWNDDGFDEYPDESVTDD